jgi:hypothetical protein
MVGAVGNKRTKFKPQPVDLQPTEPAEKTPAQREALAKALAYFRPGVPGTEQPQWLRAYLRPLEHNGYIRYQSEAWQLTDKGKAALKG